MKRSNILVFLYLTNPSPQFFNIRHSLVRMGIKMLNCDRCNSRIGKSDYDIVKHGQSKAVGHLCRKCFDFEARLEKLDKAMTKMKGAFSELCHVTFYDR